MNRPNSIFTGIRACTTGVLLNLFAGCGQDPAFTQTTGTAPSTTKSTGSSSNGTAANCATETPSSPCVSTKDSASSSTPNSAAGANGTSGTNNGTNGSTTASVTSGSTASTSGSTTSNGSGNNGSTGNSGNGSSSTNNNGGLTSAQVNDLPGVVVQKVGVNFEDMGLYGDKDFNDAVLCFAGGFKVDGTSVVSTTPQTIVAHMSSISGCHHTLTIHISNPDGSEEPVLTVDDAHIPAAGVSLKFVAGSLLDVKMQSYTAACATNTAQHTDLASVHDMSDAAYGKVLLNQCNTTGN